jgi:hypothetical protein
MLFAGGHAERFSFSNKQGILLKELKPGSEEHLNYDRLNGSHLAPFIPKYFGKLDKNGKTYVLIENLLDGFDLNKTNLIDIKVSYIKNPPLCHAFPNNFRIVGCVIDGEQIKVNKKDDFYLSLHYIKDHIKGYEHHLSAILIALKQMMDTITNNDKLYSSSLFIAVTEDKFVIKLIDFTDFESQEYPKRSDVDIDRYDIESGLKNIYQHYQYLNYHFSTTVNSKSILSHPASKSDHVSEPKIESSNFRDNKSTQI